MELGDYFDNTQGNGVLSTADAKGQVDAAVYARPYVLETGELAFIMRAHLSYGNIQANPHAVYLFHEAGPGYKGVRLYLTRVREENDPEKIKNFCRRCKSAETPGAGRHLVVFTIDRQRPLVGDDAV